MKINGKDVEQHQFDLKVRRARKIFKAIAAGDTSLPTFKKAVSAIERAEYVVRFLAKDDPRRATEEGLRREFAEAREQGDKARADALEAERRALSEKIRESRPLPGSWEHELAGMKNGRQQFARPKY